MQEEFKNTPVKNHIASTKTICDMNSQERIENNLNVLKLLANKNSKTAISPEIISKYSGWGGLREAIFDSSVYKELKCYLTEDEINSIKKSTNSAYYTPELLVKFIWSSLTKMGFTPSRKEGNCRNILEPAAGIGAFFNHMPSNIAKSSNIDAIELDRVSSKMLSKLYPNVNVLNSGFEALHCSNRKYDIIVGNPPYGRDAVDDIFNPDLSHLIIHHWFVAKSARILKDDGVIAMVLPQFFLDNNKDHARDIISEEGVNLILALRLPDNLFANAKITVDMVFLQKREKKVHWQNTKRKMIGEQSKPLNEYFFDNPHYVLGDLQIVPMYERTGITCKSNGDLRTQLLDVYSKITKIL